MDPIPPLREADLLLRLGAAIVAGTVIGLNRDLRNRPAGVRTHALVGLSSALVMVAAVELPADPVQGGEISRVIQGVLTGIGFLGAGVILRQPDRRSVRGLTTAATIWVTAALGVVCGLGKWLLAGTGVALALLVLLGGGPLERSIRRLMHRPDPSPEDD
ncbi:MAG TPA: MgtC/SapB family protein [Gemmatimonadales bacterium]|nr:MgtC/SapB family protein [Gemmatimonadales bacterium]